MHNDNNFTLNFNSENSKNFKSENINSINNKKSNDTLPITMCNNND